MASGKPFPRWAAALFIAVFGAAAIFCGYTYGKSVWNAWQARDWVAVPAQVDNWSVKSHTSTSSKGTTTSYRVVADYRYKWQGVEYGGNRVGFVGGSDNFSDDFRRRAVDAIRNPPAGHVVAWVNPDRPTQAVLVRSLAWEQALFMTVFLMIPCGIATFAAIAGIDLLRLRLANLPDSNAGPIGSIWALLHGALAIPIIALAPPGAFGWMAWLLLGLLVAVAAFGLKGVVGRLRRA